MTYKNSIILAGLTLALFTGCSIQPVHDRGPAGTGDVDSSTTESFESYKLPITRDNKKTTRVAYNFWSSEWPGPIIDVNSDVKKGKTTITAFKNLRNPTDADKVSCTIENGVYHPWSYQDPSLLNYYTLTEIADYQAVKDTFAEVYNAKKKEFEKIKIPKGAAFLNMVYYGENQCGALLKVGKTTRPFSNSCDFFNDNKDLVKTSAAEGEFTEQWLYLKCEEKDTDGKTIKAFVQDQDLLKQPTITKGCFPEYGKVQGSKNCAATP